MLVITARIGRPILIGTVQVTLQSVRGGAVWLAIRGTVLAPMHVRRGDGTLVSVVSPAVMSEGESLTMDEVSVMVARVRGPQVRLGIAAPRHVIVSTASLEVARKTKESLHA